MSPLSEQLIPLLERELEDSSMKNEFSHVEEGQYPDTVLRLSFNSVLSVCSLLRNHISVNSTCDVDLELNLEAFVCNIVSCVTTFLNADITTQ